MPDLESIPAAVAAVRLGLSRERVVRLIQQGLIDGQVRSGRWFVTAEDVEAVADQQSSELAARSRRPRDGRSPDRPTLKRGARLVSDERKQGGPDG